MTNFNDGPLVLDGAAGTLLVLDGASGTLLENDGVKLHPKLWSAIALAQNLDAVRNLHKDYFAAGANIATTVTYQASVPIFSEELGISEDEAASLLTGAVSVAKDEALKAPWPDKRFVAAGLGPYGAHLLLGQEYTGDYPGVTTSTIEKWHEPNVKAVLAGHPDILLFETIPNYTEICGIVDLVERLEISVPVWIGLSVKATDTEVTLADGTAMSEIAQKLKSSRVEAIGANCFQLHRANSVVAALKKSFDLPLILYPNSGEVYDAVKKEWNDPEHTSLKAWNVDKWVEDGVRVIGGCCRTGPEQIRAISSRVNDLKAHFSSGP